MAEIPQTFPAAPLRPLRRGEGAKRDKKNPPKLPARRDKDQSESPPKPDPDQPGIDEYA